MISERLFYMAFSSNCSIIYLGAVLYKYAPIPTKTIFGNQTAKNGDINPVTEKVVESVENKI